MADPQFSKYPDLSLSQHVFTITNPYASKAAQDASLQSLKHAIREHKMAPLYRHLAHPSDGILNAAGEGSAHHPPRLRRSSSVVSPMLATKKPVVKVDLPWDDSLYESISSENEKELESIRKEETEAEEKAGDTEVQAARAKRAEFYARVCDKVRRLRLLWCICNLMLTCCRIKHWTILRSYLKRQASWVRRLTLFSPSSASGCFSATKYW